MASWLLVAMATVASAQTTTNYRCSDKTFCLSWTYQPTANPPSIIYTLSSSTASGWLGLGLGSSGLMDGSKLYVGYKEAPTANATLVIFTAVRHSVTALASKDSNDGVVVATPASAYVLPDAVLSFSFSRPLTTSDSADVGVTAATKYIWAVNVNPPVSPTSIGKHTEDSVFDTIPEALTASSGTGTGATSAASIPGSVATSVPASSTTARTTPTAAPSAGNPLTAASRAVANYCNTAKSLCLSVVRDATTNQALFAVQSTYGGWAGIGIGSAAMAGATVYVGFNAKTGVLVSQRDSTGYTTPAVSRVQGFTLVAFPADPVNVPVLPGATISFAFTRNATDAASGAKALETTGATNFIWGGSNTAPSTTSASGSFSKHTEFGSFSLDVSKVGAVTTGSTVSSKYDVKQMRLIHGVCMFLAWGVFPYAGIFVARYLKDRMGHAWYLTHLGLMLGGVGVFTLAGLVVIELPVAEGAQRFFSTWHGTFGFALAVVVWPLQVALGFVSNHLWSPERTSIPWWDQMHWWVGRISVLGSIPLMYYGLQLIEASGLAYIGLFVWIGVCIVALVAGQFAIGVVHHVKKPEEGYAMTSDLGGRSQYNNHKY
ncbi:hypothetical protein HDU96_006715 [Phlyctochytrium bullatum]|nr:hypothetical protein HDU96_006715 [Phlyctochytrium bullatum]